MVTTWDMLEVYVGWYKDAMFKVFADEAWQEYVENGST